MLGPGDPRWRVRVERWVVRAPVKGIKTISMDFLTSQWLRHHASTTRGMDSSPSPRTHAQCSQKRKKKRSVPWLAGVCENPRQGAGGPTGASTPTPIPCFCPHERLLGSMGQWNSELQGCLGELGIPSPHHPVSTGKYSRAVKPMLTSIAGPSSALHRGARDCFLPSCWTRGFPTWPPP